MLEAQWLEAQFTRLRTIGEPSASHRLLIGDNLSVLALLADSHAARIKTIYIDPPYNTGGNRSFSDRFRPGRPPGVADTVPPPADWSAMMRPRLDLARRLLMPEGWIFVSIGHQELLTLLALMGEIFGEQNRLALLTWRGMHTVRNSSQDFNLNTEFVLAYAREKSQLLTPDKRTWLRAPRDKRSAYPHDDRDGRGAYKLDPLYARNYYRPYEHTFANGVRWSAPAGSFPRYSPARLAEMDAAGEIDFRGATPRARRYLSRVQEGVPPDTLLPREVGFNKDGTAELQGLLGAAKLFDQPKPSSLLRHLLSISRHCDRESGHDELVLDFFAGTGTTGQAVWELNRADGGRRQFILVQAAEPTRPGSAAQDHGYETVADLCQARLEAVIERLAAAGASQADLGVQVYVLPAG